MPPRTNKSGTWTCVLRLLRRTGGNSAIEYALLLAIIAGALLTAATVVGFMARDTLTIAAGGAGTGAHPAQHGRARSRQAEEDPADRAETTPLVSLYTVSYLQLAEVAIVLVLSGFLWHRLRKTLNAKRNGDAEDESETASQVPQLNHDAIFEKRQQIFNILANNMQALFESRLEVGHLMSRRVTKVAPGDSAEEVERLMREKRLRHMLVCSRDGRLEGIISDRDLARSEARTAAELMTRDPITVTPDAQVSPAITQLIQQRISCLPVVDDNGAVCGVLTTTDLMMALQCSMQMLQRIAQEVRSTTQPRTADVETPVCAS